MASMSVSLGCSETDLVATVGTVSFFTPIEFVAFEVVLETIVTKVITVCAAV